MWGKGPRTGSNGGLSSRPQRIRSDMREVAGPRRAPQHFRGENPVQQGDEALGMVERFTYAGDGASAASFHSLTSRMRAPSR